MGRNRLRPAGKRSRRSIPRRLSYGWDSSLVSSSYIAVEGLCDEGFSDMAAWRRAIELSLGETELEKLRMIARSRTEAASRVERARILLGYWENSSFFAVGQALGLHHQTVQHCVERAVAEARWPRWMIALGPAGSLRSRWKRKPG